MLTIKEVARVLGVNRQRVNHLCLEPCWRCDGAGCLTCHQTGKRLPSIKKGNRRDIDPRDLHLVQDRRMGADQRALAKVQATEAEVEEFMVWLEEHRPAEPEPEPPGIPTVMVAYCPTCEAESTHEWHSGYWRCMMCHDPRMRESESLAAWEWEDLMAHHQLTLNP